jgi:hypothetical protein
VGNREADWVADCAKTYVGEGDGVEYENAKLGRCLEEEKEDYFEMRRMLTKRGSA